MQMVSVQDLLAKATHLLGQVGVETPLLDAEVMLSEAMGVSRTHLLAHPDCHPSASDVRRFQRWLNKRVKRVPLAYVVGHKEFYGLDFEIRRGVLIPRPETELLVDRTIQVLKGARSPVIAEIGVGSGAVAVACALSIRDARIYATDVSPVAVRMARLNAKRHGVSERVRVMQGDLFEPLANLAFDAVVSNPPYVPTSEIATLQPEIRNYEPREALDGGTDGMACLHRIILEARRYIKPGGFLILEVGNGQAGAIASLMKQHGYIAVQVNRDYAGVERVVNGRFDSEQSALTGAVLDHENNCTENRP